MAYLKLDDILGKDVDELKALNNGEFEAEKLGTVPFREIDAKEYKQIKRDCMRNVPDPKGTRGAMVSELDDDQLMIKLIVSSVDKESKQPDARSNFTFANKSLLDKLGVITADQAVTTLLTIGEIFKAATNIQEACGFTDKAATEEAEEIKN